MSTGTMADEPMGAAPIPNFGAPDPSKTLIPIHPIAPELMPVTVAELTDLPLPPPLRNNFSELPRAAPWAVQLSMPVARLRPPRLLVMTAVSTPLPYNLVTVVAWGWRLCCL